MTRSLRLVTTIVLFATACRTPVDIAAATTSLLNTDREWARLAGANASVDSVVSFWTADARVIMPGQPIVIGTEALKGMVASMQKIPGFRITWTPDSAVVAPSGDVGYTYGTNSITAPDEKGVPHTTVSVYGRVVQLTLEC